MGVYGNNYFDTDNEDEWVHMRTEDIIALDYYNKGLKRRTPMNDSWSTVYGQEAMHSLISNLACLQDIAKELHSMNQNMCDLKEILMNNQRQDKVVEEDEELQFS